MPKNGFDGSAGSSTVLIQGIIESRAADGPPTQRQPFDRFSLLPQVEFRKTVPSFPVRGSQSLPNSAARLLAGGGRRSRKSVLLPEALSGCLSSRTTWIPAIQIPSDDSTGDPEESSPSRYEFSKNLLYYGWTSSRLEVAHPHLIVRSIPIRLLSTFIEVQGSCASKF
jgi:hypothetical protein